MAKLSAGDRDLGHGRPREHYRCRQKGTIQGLYVRKMRPSRWLRVGEFCNGCAQVWVYEDAADHVRYN